MREKRQPVTAIRLSRDQRRVIDRAAASVGMTRSAFLRAAAFVLISKQKSTEEVSDDG